jgi:dihydrofolate reductase
MRRVIVGAMISLDGVMQAPGGPEEDPTHDFTFGGWVAPYFDDTVGRAMGDLFTKPFDLLLGRKTYDIFAAHWPYVGPEDPIGPLFNRVTKYVATRNYNFRPEWQNSHSLTSDAIAAVRELKNQDGPDLLTQGSTDFLKSLFEAGIVDEVNVSIFPLVLGRGKRLFDDTASPAALKLVSSKVSGTGVAINKYIHSGEVVTGSFALEQPTEAELERRRNLT